MDFGCWKGDKSIAANSTTELGSILYSISFTGYFHTVFGHGVYNIILGSKNFSNNGTTITARNVISTATSFTYCHYLAYGY